MLDVPNFFWESEPTLHPLYFAVREYLEIKPRIQVLNERCRVFLDLAEILSDSIADNKMSRKSSWPDFPFATYPTPFVLLYHLLQAKTRLTNDLDLLGGRAGLTWIIIILIILSIAVTCFEVFLRFGILNKEKAHAKNALPICSMPDLSTAISMPIAHDGLL